MWRVRQKEKELEERLNKKTRTEGQSEITHSDASKYLFSTSKKARKDFSSRDGEGLKDEELEEFLHTRYYLSYHPLVIKSLMTTYLDLHDRLFSQFFLFIY